MKNSDTISMKIPKPILILKESLNEAEEFCRDFHQRSDRKDKPLIMINCSALSGILLESEIFGHEKGSFKNAYHKKIGLIEVANGGILLLYESNQLAPDLQEKLLNFLKNGYFFRIGGKEKIHSNLQLICSSKQSNKLFFEINKI